MTKKSKQNRKNYLADLKNNPRLTATKNGSKQNGTLPSALKNSSRTSTRQQQQNQQQQQSQRNMPKNENTHARKSHFKRITKKTHCDEEVKARRLEEAPAEEEVQTDD